MIFACTKRIRQLITYKGWCTIKTTNQPTNQPTDGMFEDSANRDVERFEINVNEFTKKYKQIA